MWIRLERAEERDEEISLTEMALQHTPSRVDLERSFSSRLEKFLVSHSLPPNVPFFPSCGGDVAFPFPSSSPSSIPSSPSFSIPPRSQTTHLPQTFVDLEGSEGDRREEDEEEEERPKRSKGKHPILPWDFDVEGWSPSDLLPLLPSSLTCLGLDPGSARRDRERMNVGVGVVRVVVVMGVWENLERYSLKAMSPLLHLMSPDPISRFGSVSLSVLSLLPGPDG